MARWKSTLILASVALLLSGCAAMQRSWAFSTPEVAGAQIRVTATEALITQKDVWLRIEVQNDSTEPVDLAFETFQLTLPDGQTVPGYVSYMERRMKQMSSAWDTLRRNDTSDPPLPPGGTVQVQLNFHQFGRDLRRLPTLSVDLAGLLVDGASTDLPPLVLTAPPEAPMGEHI